MDTATSLTYALGIAVSLIVQVIKKYFGINGLSTYVALAVISLIGSAIFVYAQHLPFLPIIVQVIIIAAAFHNLLIRQLQNNSKIPPAGSYYK